MRTRQTLLLEQGDEVMIGQTPGMDYMVLTIKQQGVDEEGDPLSEWRIVLPHEVALKVFGKISEIAENPPTLVRPGGLN